jgi:prepilin signal peptidase PulO-like enzyme (type II secretory pathway)
MTILILVLLGLCFGSFVNALVWRIHEQEGSRKKKADKKLSITRGRSMCPSCKHELSARDLVPILSWLSLRGKCRYCQKPISWQYPLVELITPVLFVLSYLHWPFEFGLLGWLIFSQWLVATVLFMALVIYDLRWMLLPNSLVYVLIGVSLAIVALQLGILPASDVLVSASAGVACSAGLFFVLFQISDGKWIGGGDVKLAIALGLLVGGPLNAVLMLFLASLGGSLIALPLLLLGKAKRKTQLPFGPFLIAATYIVFLFGADITLWYERVFLGL